MNETCRSTQGNRDQGIGDTPHPKPGPWWVHVHGPSAHCAPMRRDRTGEMGGIGPGPPAGPGVFPPFRRGLDDLAPLAEPSRNPTSAHATATPARRGRIPRPRTAGSGRRTGASGAGGAADHAACSPRRPAGQTGGQPALRSTSVTLHEISPDCGSDPWALVSIESPAARSVALATVWARCSPPASTNSTRTW